MIDVQDILNLHKRSIEDFGGSHGIRDLGLLESAIARPFQTFGGDLYPTVYEKAAAIAESLIINHPFIEGNKRRFSYHVCFAEKGNVELTALEEDAYSFTIDVSTGEKSRDQIVEWLKENTTAK